MNKQIYIPVTILTIFAVSLVILFNVNLEDNQNYSQISQMRMFEDWAITHNKKYQHQTIKIYRFQVFIQTLKKIQKHNKKYTKGEESYQMGLNYFSDLSDKQFSAKYFDSNQINRTLIDQICTGPQPIVPNNFSEAWDWVAKGAVTSVRNQGESCKASYAIATAQAIESYMFIWQNKLIPLSAQQIIDCSTGNGNNGCNGGDPIKSLQYLMKNGITKQDIYPYKGFNQSCAYKSNTKIWDINHCVAITPNNATLIMAALSKQPLITTIKISSDVLKSYKSGIITGCGDQNIQNYIVLIVGWGVSSSLPPPLKNRHYWKVKSSLGMFFGINGYFLLQTSGDDGICNAHANVIFPY